MTFLLDNHNNMNTFVSSFENHVLISVFKGLEIEYFSP